MNSINSNELSMELNKQNKVILEEDGEFEAIDAHFLFPKSESPSSKAKSQVIPADFSQCKSSDSEKSERKVFKV